MDSDDQIGLAKGVSDHMRRSAAEFNESAAPLQISQRSTMITLAPTILNGLDEHIIIVDQKGNIVLSNRSWVTFSLENDGDETKTGLGANYLEVCRNTVGEGRDQGLEFASLLEDLFAGRQERVELEYECSYEKEERWFLATGKPTGFNLYIISHTNITRRKVSELKVEEQNRQLEELLKTKALLVSAFSHDIKNTLTSLQGILAALKDLATTPEKREMIEIALGKLNLTDDYLKNLLIFFKNSSELASEQGRKPVNILSLIERVAHSHSFDVKAGHIDLQVDFGEGLHLHVVDPIQITMVLSNLLGNAIKYTPAGGRITVRFREGDDACGFTLSVEDTGRGIPQEAMDSLLEPYQQVHESDKGLGFGIGLNNVKRIVDAYGGEIHIDSTLGEGSCFTVNIPTVCRPMLKDPTCPEEMGPLKILFVDDDPLSRKITKLALSGKGHQVTTAKDIEEGASLYRPGSFDVLITDFNLGPQPDAYDLCARLAPTEPVICYTGESSLPGHPFEKGIASHLEKPAPLRRLLAEIAQVLG